MGAPHAASPPAFEHCEAGPAAGMSMFQRHKVLPAAQDAPGPAVPACVQPLWEFSVRDGYKSFPAEAQASVEKHFQAFAAGVGPGNVQVAIGSDHAVLVDFVAMKQRSGAGG